MGMFPQTVLTREGDFSSAQVQEHGGKPRRPEGGDLDEDEAELKVRTALERMGRDGISKAWEEFERMDPGGRLGGVREEELIEVGKRREATYVAFVGMLGQC